MTTQATRAGQRIGDTYSIDKLAARGGFSSVYRGTRLSDHEEIAIKILEMDGNVEATWIERFSREARLINQLTNPSTIRILDFGQHDQFLYIVMEFVRGRSLGRQIKKFGALGTLETAEVIRAILLSLEEAHELGILHRDMKPSNIMLGRDDSQKLFVKVLDFGVAKILDPSPEMNIALTQAGTFVGTPRYASPEQMKREAVTRASDVYGVGMVMWECLVGDPAVPGVDFQAAIEFHLGPQPWRLPESIVCPPELAGILYKALEKRPEKRYQSCRDMRLDLERFVVGEMGLEARTLEAPTLEAKLDVSRYVEDAASMAGDFEPGHWLEPSEAYDEVPMLHPIGRPEAVVRADTSRPASRDAASIEPKPQVPEEQLELAFEPRAGIHARAPAPAVTAKRNRRSTGAPRWLAGGIIALAVCVAVGVLGWRVIFPRTVERVVVESTTPQIAADAIILAIRTGGWQPGKLDTRAYEDVRRTSLLATKDRRVVTLTIYECLNENLARALQEDASPPDEAVRLGRTVVKVSSTDPGSTQKMAELLRTLREILVRDGHL